MHTTGFAEAIESIVQTHPGYDREAYLFLRDALEFAVKLHKKGKQGTSRHVAAAELLEGFRQYAIKEFGPMVPTVLESWGIRGCEDIGRMVFLLIEAGAFGKTENDSINDFSPGFDFHEAFVAPFLPAGRAKKVLRGECREGSRLG